ncbi:MAG: glutamate synthase subunit alpha, partial [Cytophagales bacterium]|nr:glutamate synthase subunit alpha [Cytophagales bacterium]
YEIIEQMVDNEQVTCGLTDGITHYIHALEKGLLKILSKMGISTLQSYRGAQIFEALGLADDVIQLFFTGTTSRIGGATLEILAQETLNRHYDGFSEDQPALGSGGIYRWKRDGEFHLWNPKTVLALQKSSRENDYEKYKQFAGLINNQQDNPTTLRGVLAFETHPSAISLEEVESAEHIYKRLATGAMSFGALSGPAHQVLAIAMNRLGGKSNTGEGGEDPKRFEPLPNGDSMR